MFDISTCCTWPDLFAFGGRYLEYFLIGAEQSVCSFLILRLDLAILRQLHHQIHVVLVLAVKQLKDLDYTRVVNAFPDLDFVHDGLQLVRERTHPCDGIDVRCSRATQGRFVEYF